MACVASETLLKLFQDILGSVIVVLLPVGLCYTDTIPARAFGGASAFLCLWNMVGSLSLHVDISAHGSLLLGALLARSLVYFLSFVQDTDYAPSDPAECSCDVKDDVSKLATEFVHWFYSTWFRSLVLRKIICSELRHELSKQAFKLRLHDLQHGELKHLSVKRLKTGSVERDAGTKRLKHLELKFKLEITRCEGDVQFYVGRNPYPHFYLSFESAPRYDLITRSSVKGTQALVQGAVKKMVRAVLKKNAVMPKYHAFFLSPLGNFKLVPSVTPIGWSLDMINSTLEATVGCCCGVRLASRSVSPAPLFDIQQAVFRPPICFDLKAHISETAPFGMVVGFRPGRGRDEVEILQIARGSRFEDILEPGDHIQAVNGKQVSDVDEAHELLQAAVGSAQIEVVRHPSFSWSHKKKRMVPKDNKLKLHRDLYYSEEFDPWEGCTARGCTRIPLSWAEGTLSDGTPPHKTGVSSTTSFFESFKLNLSKKRPIINVAVFSISAKVESELLSFAAIPLSLILPNCCKVLSGRTSLVVPLLNPHIACWGFRPQAEMEKMIGESDFDPRCCNGEIEMFFKWNLIAEQDRKTADSTPSPSTPETNVEEGHEAKKGS